MRDLYGTAFVGRRVELEHLAQLAAAGARLITIVGPPGTGKSRLADRAAQLVEHQHSRRHVVGLVGPGQHLFHPLIQRALIR